MIFFLTCQLLNQQNCANGELILKLRREKTTFIDPLIKGLFTWRWGTPGRWGNQPVHIISHFKWGDPPRFTSPTWGPPRPCKQALSLRSFEIFVMVSQFLSVLFSAFSGKSPAFFVLFVFLFSLFLQFFFFHVDFTEKSESAK